MRIKDIYSNCKVNDYRNNHGSYGNIMDEEDFTLIEQDDEYYLIQFNSTIGDDGTPIRLFYHERDIEFESVDNQSKNEIILW